MDWNLIPALHALLQEASVSRAAQRLGVTVPSMSRMLKRLREGLADPLLVRAGRGLVLTPYAVALQSRVAALSADGQAILAGPRAQSLDTLVQTLVVRTNDGVVGPLLPLLLKQVHTRAKGLTLAFVSEGEESPAELRDGRVDLDLGVLDDSAPELRTQTLLRDRFVAVVRVGHPLAGGIKRPAQLTQFQHIGVSRRGRFSGPLDRALQKLGPAPSGGRHGAFGHRRGGRGGRVGPRDHGAEPRRRDAPEEAAGGGCGCPPGLAGDRHIPNLAPALRQRSRASLAAYLRSRDRQRGQPGKRRPPPAPRRGQIASPRRTLHRPACGAHGPRRTRPGKPA